VEIEFSQEMQVERTAELYIRALNGRSRQS
jgi:hypothetical protein